ncbi:MAG: AAA family ATPase [Oligoflexales bacterium]
MNNEEIQKDVETLRPKIASTLEMISRKVVGQRNVCERLVMGLIANGHVLLEGMPGLAKTTAVKALSESSDLSVKRIQFTPDLLPADVIGTMIYNPKNMEFMIKKGPVFTNLLIADEINRAPAKVQSALLEAMQERQVTIGDQTFPLADPFLVMATQNPIEQEGTYALPEAQVDRFLFKVKVDYCTPEEEIQIVSRLAQTEEPPLEKVLTRDDILRLRSLVSKIYVSDKVRQYIIDVVFATRYPEKFGLTKIKDMLQYGASPRGSITLDLVARVAALFDGRSYVIPQDVKDVAKDVLRHRIIPTYEAEAENVTADDLIQTVFDHVDVP